MLVLLANIGNILLIFNLFLFSIGFRKQQKAFKIFACYLGVIFIIQMASKILISFHFQNLYLSHFYFIGQFILLSFFYWTLLKKEYQKKIIKMSVVLCLLALGIQYTIIPNLFFKFNLFEIFITSFLIIIFTTFHFYNLLNEKKEYYYINMGILMYLFGSTILFLVGNLMSSLSPKLNLVPWILNAFLYIIYQFFILFEWKKSFSKKTIITTL